MYRGSPMVPDPWDFASLPALMGTSGMKGSLSLSDDDKVDVDDKVADEFLETMRSKKRKVVLQSNLQSGVIGSEVTVNQQEIVSYDESEAEGNLQVAAIYDEVTSDIYTGDFELGEFLSRPVELANGKFTVGSNFATSTLSPWSLFLNKAAIKNKIANYSYIQCTLKIKVVLNSTPFVFGLFGLSYAPLQGLTVTADNGLDFRCLSQRPSIWIEPHKNKGGEMELPFFHYKNWLELDSLTDVGSFGKLDLYQVVQAKAANADLTIQPSYTIYAWAENVKLCGNTVKAVLQSKDEYGENSVSAVASAASSVAQSLIDVPVIGPFAKATEIGCSAVSSIAKMFGFTNVPVIDNAHPYKSMPFHGLASSEIGNVVEKLTLDPKNELSIAPGTVGLPDTDELGIQHLISKEAIITKVEWDKSQNQNTSLFRAQVTPTICNVAASGDEYKLLDTPLGMVSRMCSNWRGDIIIRMKVIASQYHRGRLRVSYDPQGNIFTNDDSTTVVQTKIIDISDTTDIQFRIPYMAPTSWLRTRGDIEQDYDITTAASTMAYDDDFHNGRFQIRVLNSLSAPTDTAPATIVISVRGADNFEIANPSDIQFVEGLSSPFVIQSKSSSGNIDESTGEEVALMVMGKVTKPPANRYLVNMGEQFSSLRTLLRRSCFVGQEVAFRNGAGTNNDTFYKMVMSKYPPFYGYDPKGIHLAKGISTPGSDFPFNYTTVTPYTWLAPCFIGQRGSMIWHFNTSFPGGSPSVKIRRITETDVDTVAEIRTVRLAYTSGNNSDAARNSISRSGPGTSGVAVTNQGTQSALSVLMPQYNKYRFVSTSPTAAVLGSDKDDTENEKFAFEIVAPASTANVTCSFERYCSIGTDFTFFFFLNVPPRHIYNVPTAAT